MRSKLDDGDIQARKAYLKAVISRIEVDDDRVRIMGDRTHLAAAVAGHPTQGGNVRGFVRNWRARNASNWGPDQSIAVQDGIDIVI